MTRRPATLLRSTVLLAATAIALTACGSNDTETETASAPVGGAFPATVATKFGEVTVDAAPERVAALGWAARAE